MDNKLNKLEEELIEKLNSLPERDKLKEIEQKILSDQECRKLIDVFQQAQDDYNFYLKSFGENHEYTRNAQKRLYEAKLKMDEQLLIKEYNDVLKVINEPLRYIEYNLISLFSRKRGHTC